VARVSATPGKTRMLNVYEARFPRPGRAGTDRTAYVLDLPGYGYARASKSDRHGYRALVAATLERPALVGVIWLLDLRRDPSPDDLDLFETLGQSGARVLAALTKSDTLPRGARRDREQALRETLGMDSDQVLATSVRTGEGVEDLRRAVAALVAGAAG